MKYILRFLCAVIIYPLFLIYSGILIVIVNIGIIIWHFNTKHLFWFDNYHFYIIKDGGYYDIVEDKMGNCKPVLRSYDIYYKNPYDMIMNIKTEVYHVNR
jgi:hypothetical protein